MRLPSEPRGSSPVLMVQDIPLPKGPRWRRADGLGQATLPDSGIPPPGDKGGCPLKPVHPAPAQGQFMKGAGTASSPVPLPWSRQITGDAAVPAPAFALRELALGPDLVAEMSLAFPQMRCLLAPEREVLEHIEASPCRPQVCGGRVDAVAMARNVCPHGFARTAPSSPPGCSRPQS